MTEIGTLSIYIREKIDEILSAVRGLTEEQLNEVPGLAGANSAFVIATHTFGNLRAFVIGIACGQGMSRNRPAEFASRGTYEELATAAGNLSRDIESALGDLDPARLPESFVPAQELWGEGEPREMTRRAALVHALEHAGIHLGHLHMTVALVRSN